MKRTLIHAALTLGALGLAGCGDESAAPAALNDAASGAGSALSSVAKATTVSLRLTGLS